MTILYDDKGPNGFAFKARRLSNPLSSELSNRQGMTMKMFQYKTYEDARKHFTWDQAWELFDGTPDNFNMGYECIDRHIDKGTAVRIIFADGHREHHTFERISVLSSRFAHGLANLGVETGDRVAVMLDPCLEFYVCLFGAMKRGAIAVPFYPQFGPEALDFRLNDATPKVLVTTEEVRPLLPQQKSLTVLTVGPSLDDLLDGQPDVYTSSTTAKDVAVFQYSSGTTRKFPEAIKHYHRSVVTLMPAAIFGRGLRLGDRYFCPSTPTWGHGLWHGTLAPLALGIAIGAYSGKFDIRRFLEALEEFEIDNLGAAPTVYRMMKNCGLVSRYKLKIKKMHYTGEPMDTDTFQYLVNTFGVPPHSGYGSTEAGAIIYQYAGFKDWRVKPLSLGKPMPGIEISLLDQEGNEVPPGTIGEIAMRRRRKWFRVKDAAVMDEDGYFWHKGRVDDVIISAGWTISPTEIEDVFQKHPAVLETAVLGVPDKERGQVVKAFVVTDRDKSDELKRELQNFVKERLSKHEYPRLLDFIDCLPKTEGGKIDRKTLKALEGQANQE